ncbi:discoidin domain-containing protein [Polaribacter reichenbachii]|nr:discoidin domain-containing protein [Polaribacter reichenbachii]
MKKTSIKYLVGSILFVILFSSLFFTEKLLWSDNSFEIEKENEEHDPDEHPEGSISIEEKLINNKHAKLASLKGNLKKNASTNSSYADGLINGNWSEVKFTTSQNSIYTSYGYRVDGSVYDKGNDIIYVISYAGHLFRVDRDEANPSNTQWTLLDNKNNYNDDADDMYLYGINLPDGSFRMIRSRDNSLLEYSDDEGRSWNNANVRYHWSCQDVGVAKTSSGLDRIATFASINTSTRKPYFSTDGITYTASTLSFPRNQYTGHIVKPLKSKDIYLFMRNSSTKKMSIYKLGPDDADYQLVHSPDFVFANFGNVMATEIDGVTHFTIAGNKHVYYSSDSGENWVTKTTNSGNNAMRTMHPSQPNILFSGDTDLRMSKNFGVSHEGFSNRQGWDIQHQRMYEKTDGTVFHLIGNDFGAFMSYTPEDKYTYIQLNNSAPTQMAYDAAHSENYNKSFTALQDRGARSFPLNSTSTGSGEIRSTDAFRVTVSNEGASVWAWIYFGTLYHQDFAVPGGIKTDLNFTGSWWASPLISSLQKGEDAVYVAAGEKIRKFTYNSNSNKIIQTEHSYDFGAKTGNKVSGLGFSTLNRNKWYVSTEDGQFLYSNDNGQSFEISDNLKEYAPKANTTGWGNWTKNQQVIRASKLDENTVYFAGVGNRFYISKDGGNRFENYTTGLNVFQIRDFALSSDEKFIFAAAGKSGPWVFSVEKNRWYSMVDASVPTVDYTHVQYLEKTNTIVFSTYGSGVLKFKLDTPEDAILAPTDLKVTSNNGEVQITWVDNSTNETNFILERSINNEFVELASLVSNSVSFTDYNLPNNTLAIYRVKAIDTNNESKYSNYAMAKYDANAELKKDWELVSVTSDESVKNGSAKNAWDSDISTMWHTQWFNITPLKAYPHELVIDMNNTASFKGFSYLPRQDGNQNGRIKDYEFYVSSDNVNWSLAAKGTWENTQDRKDVIFSEEVIARYIKLVGLSEVNGKSHGTCAELSIFKEIPAPASPHIIQGARISDTQINLKWLDLSNNENGFKIEEYVNEEFVEVASASKNATSLTFSNTDKSTWHRYRITAYNDIGSNYSATFDIRGEGENTLGLDENKNIVTDNIINVYPNPFKNQIKFKISNNSNNFTDWMIYDSIGSLVKKGKVNEFEKNGISTINFSSGIYFIKFKGNIKNITKKIIKR